MTRTCIHIGPSKTGTTTLQREIFARHSQIAYLGKPFCSAQSRGGGRTTDRSRLEESLILALRSKDSLQYDESSVIEEIKRHIEEYPPGSRVPVLSEEGLAASGMADRGLIAERLSNAFGVCDILITIRSQLTCLPSLFLHYYRRGDFVGLTFDGWLNQDPQSRQRARVYETWAQYDYYSLYQLYRRVFPKGRVKVALFEQMTRNSDAFAKEISEFLGVDCAETRSLFQNAQHLNPGMSVQEADFHRRFQRVRHLYGQVKERCFPGLEVQKYVPFASKARAYGKRTVQRILINEGKAARNPTQISEASTRMIWERFAQSNRRLAEECNLPIVELGYPV